MRIWRQDVVPALLLCETVYKAADLGETAALRIMDTMQRELPEHVSSPLLSVQWSQPQGRQR